MAGPVARAAASGRPTASPGRPTLTSRGRTSALGISRPSPTTVIDAPRIGTARAIAAAASAVAGTGPTPTRRTSGIAGARRRPAAAVRPVTTTRTAALPPRPSRPGVGRARRGAGSPGSVTPPTGSGVARTRWGTGPPRGAISPGTARSAVSLTAGTATVGNPGPAVSRPAATTATPSAVARARTLGPAAVGTPGPAVSRPAATTASATATTGVARTLTTRTVARTVSGLAIPATATALPIGSRAAPSVGRTAARPATSRRRLLTSPRLVTPGPASLALARRSADIGTTRPSCRRTLGRAAAAIRRRGSHDVDLIGSTRDPHAFSRARQRPRHRNGVEGVG